MRTDKNNNISIILVLNIFIIKELEKLADIIFMFFMVIPIYIILLWTYFDPESSLLWKRWMYKDGDISERAKLNAKILSVLGMIMLTLLIISFII
ncbi:hypothetical protein ACFSCX_16160 [Bacillus salitolerans]|uniref:Histidine kinase n=1 Tax=Bacillus salitolerans TaxID=1437434 RepID=A0ABW4LVC5_9BACI